MLEVLLLLLLLRLEMVRAAYVHGAPLLLRWRLLRGIPWPQAEAAWEGSILHAALLQGPRAWAGRGNAVFPHQAITVCAGQATPDLGSDATAGEAVGLGLCLEETGRSQAVICASQGACTAGALCCQPLGKALCQAC